MTAVVVQNEAADLLMEQIEAQLENSVPGYQRRPMALRDRVREAMGSALDEALASASAHGAQEIAERFAGKWLAEAEAIEASGTGTRARRALAAHVMRTCAMDLKR